MDDLKIHTVPPTARQGSVSPSGLERIELKHLEHVLEICRAGSFSAAARRLKLSQPALSKSISRLEAQLGLHLFERNGGAARPTELAELIAERGRALLASSNALSRELEQRASGVTGRLRIGVGPTTRLKPLPQVVRGVLARFPDIKLEATLDNGLAIMRGVDQGRYDVAFGYSENAEAFGDLIRVKIFDDQPIVVVRPGHPATSANHPLSSSELLQYPMASVGITSNFGAWIGELTEAEAHNVDAYVSNDVEMLRACFPANYTLRGARFVFADDLAAGRLVELPLEWESTYHCWMVTTPENWRLPVVKAVADIARETAVEAIKAA
jgi:DNA-binding transcriptional LysR family regulator